MPRPSETAVPVRTRLQDLPVDILLLICDVLPLRDLPPLSQASRLWSRLIHHRVYPRRVASLLGVRAVRLELPPGPALLPPSMRPLDPTPRFWPAFVPTLAAHRALRTLHVCVPLSRTDSVNSLALEFDVSRADIFHTNALLNDSHLACRTHLYLPLLDDDAVRRATGRPTASQAPILVRDLVLKNKHFFVVDFRTVPQLHPHQQQHAAGARRQTYVRQLVVKLIAKGLAVHEDEVRFYLDDNNFDVAAAYKQLLRDHQFSP